jgi:hypothetical protein
MQRKRVTCLALLVAACVLALAAGALAAEPKATGAYGGAFKNGKNYVAIYARKSGKVTLGNVQYSCKGKPVIAQTPNKFRPRKLTSNGSFVLKFKATIRNNGVNGGQKVASGRVTIRGRFVSSTRVDGSALVKSKKCPKRKRPFTANGPQIEG